MEPNKTLIKLVNPKFTIEFMEKEYEVRKATLDKVVQYQMRAKELINDPALDSKLVSFAMYLILKEQIPELTEDLVLQNIPGDISVLETLVSLGFMNSSKMETVKAIQDKVINQ